MSLENMLLNNEISREPPTSGEVPRFRESIKNRLEDANNTSNHNQTRLEQAYYAIFNCAWIALRVDGYRTNSGRGHHRVVLESLEHTMGAGNEDIDYFLDLSRTRGSDLYDAIPVTDTDVSEAIEAATSLAEKLASWLDDRGV